LIQTNIAATPESTSVSSVRHITNAFATSNMFDQDRTSIGESTMRHFSNIKAAIEVKFGRSVGESGISAAPISNEWTD
jgi:hypothetical protein